jgi:hypothetical protein
MLKVRELGSWAPALRVLALHDSSASMRIGGMSKGRIVK